MSRPTPRGPDRSVPPVSPRSDRCVCGLAPGLIALVTFAAFLPTLQKPVRELGRRT
jgi:hypothetical protein